MKKARMRNSIRIRTRLHATCGHIMDICDRTS